MGGHQNGAILICCSDGYSVARQEMRIIWAYIK